MAKAFRFSLQKVLDVRKQVEELMAVHLKQSQVKLDTEARIMEELHTKKESTMDESTNIEDLSVTQLQLAMDYIQQINEMIAKQQEIVKLSEQKVEENRSKLIKASQDKKVVESLKEKQFESWHKDNKKREQNKENEIAQEVIRKKVIREELR